MDLFSIPGKDVNLQASGNQECNLRDLDRLDRILRRGKISAVDHAAPEGLTVPVYLQSLMDILLAKPELHDPFTGLQDTIYPCNLLLEGQPASTQHHPQCIWHFRGEMSP